MPLKLIIVPDDKKRMLRFVEMTNRLDFQDAVKLLRKKWGIVLTDDISEETFTNLLEDTKLSDDVKKMLENLDIPWDWEEVVQRYLIENDAPQTNTPDGWVIKNQCGVIIEIPLEGNSLPTVSIGSDATQQDYKNAWKEIKKYRKEIPKRKRFEKNFLRDKQIFELAQTGQTVAKIAITIDKKFGGEIGIGNVKKIVSTENKKRGIPKSERPKLYMGK
jgi:hypothetical protein